jgi:hypothetical protein
MNVAAMASVALLVFVEKVMPWGRGFGRVAALLIMAYGVLVMLRPRRCRRWPRCWSSEEIVALRVMVSPATARALGNLDKDRVDSKMESR